MSVVVRLTLESIRVMSKLGYKQVNQYKLSTKYMCKEFKTI